MYVWHVLNHKISFLWRFHAVHHADKEVDASTALRFHTGEIVFSTLARLVVLPLLGMTLPQLFLYEAILLPVILFHHSNVRVPYRLDTALRWLIPTPWMHWVHHSRWRPETDSNYGSVLSIWDRIFGTLRLRDDPWRLNLGLEEDQEESEWRTLLGMLVRPFRRKIPNTLQMGETDRIHP
jgi:sterol desaturase/sphingolipid hydroxylase (fatty acid hydroxylase superfamily)